ncbi:MAG: redoxin domain-containing protein [Pirellulaceae bacterium]
MPVRRSVYCVLALSLFSIAVPFGAALAAKPTAEQALQLTPIQDDVDFTTPTGEELQGCQIESINKDGLSGWIVSTGDGAMLRSFLDTNRDNKVDLWCYYKDGIEVYRDIDGNYNGKADQYRWLGTGGTRWGIDRDEDGVIDAWRMISAEEVSAEVVAALRDRDADRFTRLLLTADELTGLGLGDARAKEIRDSVSAAAAEFAQLAREQSVVTSRSNWVHFGGHRPGVVPKGMQGSTKDLVVYDNVAAVVETEGKHSQLGVGTLIQVGDVWRLIDTPQNLREGQASTAAGFFFQASLANLPDSEEPTVAAGLSEESQQLIADYQKIDEQLSRASTPAQQNALNAQRADVLEKLIDATTDAENRANWVRQYADTVGPAAQSGDFPEGTRRLATLLEKLARQTSDKDLLAYVKYRYLTAQYGQAIADPKADFAKIQEQWQATLEQFVKDYPGSPDSADAMLQLALAQEFAGQDEDARKWYTRIATEHPGSPLAKKAAGAVTRLDSVGKSIPLRAPTIDGKTFDLSAYRGRVVLIHYWSTWCEPCKQDLTVLRQLLAKYGRDGFSLVGVNLDNERGDVVSYLTSNRLPWPQLYEEGGLDSRLATDLGILTLPTMILIDKQGRVVSRNISAGELDAELPKVLR